MFETRDVVKHRRGLGVWGPKVSPTREHSLRGLYEPSPLGPERGRGRGGGWTRRLAPTPGLGSPKRPPSTQSRPYTRKTRVFVLAKGAYLGVQGLSCAFQ